MRGKTWVWLGVLALGLAVTLLAPVAWLVVDEGAVPPASDAPALTAGLSLTDAHVRCGSGGCWREWTVRGASPDQVARERCAARSLLDRRVVCTSWYVAGDEVRLAVRFQRPGE